PAEDDVARSQLAAQPLVDVNEQAVARGVAVRVVDRLEAVEVEEAEPRGSASTPHPRLLGRKRLRERIAVRRVRERVDAGARAFLRQCPLEAEVQPLPDGEQEQQSSRVRQREGGGRAEEVEKDDEQRSREAPG